MLGVIDVGGGLRGTYGAGIFDRFMKEDIHFDYGAGVSAGAANVVSYMAGQAGRNYQFYLDYAFRKQYMSLSNFIRTGSYVDLEYIYGDALSNRGGEYPLDFGAMQKSDMQLTVVATDARTAKPVYYALDDMSWDDYGAIKASSCLPVACPPYAWKGRRLYDGGLSDPIPYEKCFADGCDHVVLILTKPKDYRRDPAADNLAVRIMRHKNPKIAQAIADRAEVYNKQLDAAVRLEEEGKMCILAPDSIEGMKTLSRDRKAMKDLYDKGCADAAGAFDFIWENS